MRGLLYPILLLVLVMSHLLCIYLYVLMVCYELGSFLLYHWTLVWWIFFIFSVIMLNCCQIMVDWLCSGIILFEDALHLLVLWLLAMSCLLVTWSMSVWLFGVLVWHMFQWHLLNMVLLGVAGPCWLLHHYRI